MIKEKGFTIIELIVVIVVIVTLGALFSATLNIQRAKARDTKRLADIEVLRKSLELYHSHNDKFPQADEWISIETSGDFAEEISPYISEIPKDPLYPQSKEGGYFNLYSYQYIASEGGRDFKIHAELETGGFVQIYSDGGEDLGGDLDDYICIESQGKIICQKGEGLSPEGGEIDNVPSEGGTPSGGSPPGQPGGGSGGWKVF